MHTLGYALLVAAFAVAAAAHDDADTLRMVNVSYASGPAPSGNITLKGTIVMPPRGTTSGDVPGIVLVSGSGPNDRWENIGPLKPLYYVAVDLAARGYAVLAYDKRTCSGATHPICAYRTFCTSPGVPAGCENLANSSVYDFASDAAQSVRFLSQYPGVKSTGLALVGHSQGCTVAVEAASWVSDIVDSVVTLMGDGTTPDLLLQDQTQAQLPLYQEALAYWEKQPPSKQQAAEVAALKGHIGASKCTIANAVPQFNLIRDGVVATGEAVTICPMGTFWQGGHGLPAGVHCPADCGQHVCWMNASNTCYDTCEIGQGLAACWPLPFAASYLQIATNTTRLKALHSLSGRILALNSWQDLLVVPPVFLPLHKMLQTLTNVDVTITTFYNVTHDLTNAGSTATNVSSKVLDALNAFFPTQA